MRILGIDPGLNITGYGVLDVDNDQQLSLVEAGIIEGGRNKEMPNRLRQLFDGINNVLGDLKPDVVAMEELYSHYERPKTAILMGHARGVFCLAVGQHGIPLAHYAATQVKRVLTGNGRAPKQQVQLAVTRQLNLESTPEPPDVADALAIAACHYFLTKSSAIRLD